MLPRRIWLCVPPLLLCAIDSGLTLAHQPKSWWQGDYATVREGNPLVRALMLYGPAVTIAGDVAYVVCFSAVLLFWHNALTRVLAFLLTLGHAIGATTWLVAFYGEWGLIAALCLMVGAERLLGWSWRRATLDGRDPLH